MVQVKRQAYEARRSISDYCRCQILGPMAEQTIAGGGRHKLTAEDLTMRAEAEAMFARGTFVALSSLTVAP